MTTYNRIELPHPILKPGNNDYEVNIRFKADPVAIRHSAQAKEIIIGLKYTLNSPVLNNLIQDGRAQYQTLTECVATRLRELHHCSEDIHTIRLNTDQYHDEVQLRPFIIATTDISVISNDDWIPDIKALLPNGTDVPSGAILAIGPENTFNLNTAAEYESYIDIAPSTAVEPQRFKIDLSGQRIVILIHPQDKLDIDRLRQDEDSRQNLFPSIYLNAIEQAVRQHRQDEHVGKRWSRRIAEKLAENNIAADDQEILQANSLDYAQQIMDNPLARITAPTVSQQDNEE